MCMQGSACTVVVVLGKSEDEAVVFEEEVEALGEECIELEEEEALEEGEEEEELLSFVPDIFFCCICFVSVFYIIILVQNYCVYLHVILSL